MEQGNLRQEDAIRFITGGNALFTCKSNLTGKRYTYKVLIDAKDETMLNVNVLTGKDNTSNYTKIGVIYSVEGTPFFDASRIYKSGWKESIIAFNHIFNNLIMEKYMPQLEIWHEGRCCRCGRVLTVPESIAMGIGPECVFKTQRFAI